MAVRLQLQETGSVFEPSVGGDLLKTIITDIYRAASLPARISMSRYDNLQVTVTSLLQYTCSLDFWEVN